ncbi:hypothetical protein ZWY2020_024599 [Hordeum vulgare]|nr:hypothetical protein ZWY2020_024599 [Hordeum vulgare]
MMVGYTILTDLDCCSNKWRWPAYSESFKVLIISVDKGQPGYNLHVSTPAEHGTLAFRQTSSFYTFSVCTKTAHMSVTRLPIMQNHLNLNLYSEPMLSVTNDDTLSLLHLYRKCTMLEISTCQGDNKSENGGPIAPMIKLNRPTQTKIDLVQCMCVGEMSGKLPVNDNQGCVHIVDLQTSALGTVTEWFHGSVETAIPFEMDWPAFFMSFLADNGVKRTKTEGAIQKTALFLGTSSCVSNLWTNCYVVALGQVGATRIFGSMWQTW